MLKACKYCGKLHEHTYVCPRKPKYKRFSKDKKVSKFRSSIAWQKVRDSVYQRDLCLCRICLKQGMLTSEDIEVHHIVPIAENWETKLDEDNLISLCHTHHELAECGKIPREKLLGIVAQAVENIPALPIEDGCEHD